MKSKTPIYCIFNGLIILLILLLSTNVSAQMIITGQVVEENNDPIFGANVKVIDSSLGTTTDTLGKFELEIESSSPIDLIITYIGYKDKIIERADTT